MAEHPKVESALSNLTYPATRAQIVAHATQNGADAGTLVVLNAIPDQSYADFAAVSTAANAQP